jgi:hypothetical protein
LPRRKPLLCTDEWLKFFVSPVVSPGRVKTGKVLITPEERITYSIRSNIAACALLMTSANWCKHAVLSLGNPCSVR